MCERFLIHAPQVFLESINRNRHLQSVTIDASFLGTQLKTFEAAVLTNSELASCKADDMLTRYFSESGKCRVHIVGLPATPCMLARLLLF
jgi:hypothetical protein